MFFVHSENPKLLGVTVKDTDTVGYTFFLYKCSVENYECEVSCWNLIPENHAVVARQPGVSNDLCTECGDIEGIRVDV